MFKRATVVVGLSMCIFGCTVETDPDTSGGTVAGVTVPTSSAGGAANSAGTQVMSAGTVESAGATAAGGRENMGGAVTLAGAPGAGSMTPTAGVTVTAGLPATDMSTGGASTGGTSTGGTSTGGASTGGASTGGVSTGGTSAGGTSAGGESTGGASTGGATTGGASTGGASTGGASTGGASTGGAVAGGADDDAQQGVCEPGEDFDADDGCNTCTCPPSGLVVEAVCTRIGCIDPCTLQECGPPPGAPDRQCEDGSFAGFGECQRFPDGGCGYPREFCPEELCEPGEQVPAADDCNTCECPPSGLIIDAMACTERVCGPCNPGDNFPAADGCNSCICPASGQKADATDCTEEVCEPVAQVCARGQECGDGQYCDFPNDDCGIFGGEGLCREIPEVCPQDAPGACGCNGQFETNSCELAGRLTDEFKYGGCSANGGEMASCGEMSCNADTDYCRIGINALPGPNQLPFFGRCVAFSDDCPAQDCTCLEGQPNVVACIRIGLIFLIQPAG